MPFLFLSYYEHESASTRSQTELENLGIGDRISRTVVEVSKGISEREKYFSMVVDEVNVTLQNKKKYREKSCQNEI